MFKNKLILLILIFLLIGIIAPTVDAKKDPKKLDDIDDDGKLSDPDDPDHKEKYDKHGNELPPEKQGSDDEDDDNDGKKDKQDKDSKNQFRNDCDLSYTLDSKDSFDGVPEGYIYWAKNMSREAGTVDVYNDATNLHVKVTLYTEVKPYVAFGEKDRDDDGVVEEDEIRSDGITFTLDGTTYEWYYHSSTKDPEVTVPHGDKVRTMFPIVYSLKAPTSGLPDPVSICINLHASPNYKTPSPPTPIPEFSSIAIPVAAILGLLLFFSRRK
jgi:hypothetical protein